MNLSRAAYMQWGTQLLSWLFEGNTACASRLATMHARKTKQAFRSCSAARTFCVSSIPRNTSNPTQLDKICNCKQTVPVPERTGSQQAAPTSWRWCAQTHCPTSEPLQHRCELATAATAPAPHTQALWQLQAAANLGATPCVAVTHSCRPRGLPICRGCCQMRLRPAVGALCHAVPRAQLP